MASSVTVTVIDFCARFWFSWMTMSSRIWIRSPSFSALNRMISSRRFRNSGLKVRLTSFPGAACEHGSSRSFALNQPRFPLDRLLERQQPMAVELCEAVAGRCASHLSGARCSGEPESPEGTGITAGGNAPGDRAWTPPDPGRVECGLRSLQGGFGLSSAFRGCCPWLLTFALSGHRGSECN